MKLSRRQVIGLSAAGIGLAGCETLGLSELPKPSMPFGGGPEGPFTFATVGDLHVLDAKSVGIVNRAVMSINENPSVHFTTVLGDLGTDGAHAEMALARSSLAKLNRPYFAVPGNHDVDPTATQNEYANYEKFFEDKEWREEESDWAFIGLDTCNGTASDVTVPGDRMEWLANQVGKINQNRPIALLAHHPFNPNTKAYRVKNADAVLDLFEGHNLKLVASGHYHGNQVEERNGVMFTTTACCSTTRNNFDGTEAKGYRLFTEQEDGSLATEFVPVPA